MQDREIYRKSLTEQLDRWQAILDGYPAAGDRESRGPMDSRRIVELSEILLTLREKASDLGGEEDSRWPDERAQLEEMRSELRQSFERLQSERQH